METRVHVTPHAQLRSKLVIRIPDCSAMDMSAVLLKAVLSLRTTSRKRRLAAVTVTHNPAQVVSKATRVTATTPRGSFGSHVLTATEAQFFAPAATLPSDLAVELRRRLVVAPAADASGDLQARIDMPEDLRAHLRAQREARDWLHQLAAASAAEAAAEGGVPQHSAAQDSGAPAPAPTQQAPAGRVVYKGAQRAGGKLVQVTVVHDATAPRGQDTVLSVFSPTSARTASKGMSSQRDMLPVDDPALLRRELSTRLFVGDGPDGSSELEMGLAPSPTPVQQQPETLYRGAQRAGGKLVAVKMEQHAAGMGGLGASDTSLAVMSPMGRTARRQLTEEESRLLRAGSRNREEMQRALAHRLAVVDDPDDPQSLLVTLRADGATPVPSADDAKAARLAAHRREQEKAQAQLRELARNAQADGDAEAARLAAHRRQQDEARQFLAQQAAAASAEDDAEAARLAAHRRQQEEARQFLAQQAAAASAEG